jgi:uncharacterized surface protein with fasciclin (FAS1) repeats
MKNILGALGTGLLCLSVTACNSNSSPVAPSEPTPAASLDARPSSLPAAAAKGKPTLPNIVELVLADDGEFDVLQAAVVRAGLVGALSGNNKLTVFAPTDAAFVSTLGVADEAAAIAAVNGLPLEALTDILLFHVTEGVRISRSVLAAPRYTMLNGKTLTRDQLTAAGIAATDIKVSNGVVHVINGVLIPTE